MSNNIKIMFYICVHKCVQMNASEFRIGNLVYYNMVDKFDERKAWKEITTIDAEDILYIQNNPDDNLYEPIRINETLLRNIGFKRMPSTVYGSKLRVYTLKNLTYNSMHGFWYAGMGHIKNQPKYIHEIQNIHFSLEREELITDLLIKA